MIMSDFSTDKMFLAEGSQKTDVGTTSIPIASGVAAGGN
jgi:hypothetical protein